LYECFRYLKDGVSKTDFIGILPLPDGKAYTITETLVTFLTEDLGLQLAKMCALGSDGAKVMVGRQNCVAAQLRRRVPHLVNNHCVAHILALAVGQAAKKDVKNRIQSNSKTSTNEKFLL
jgi:hypothetical protein